LPGVARRRITKKVTGTEGGETKTSDGILHYQQSMPANVVTTWQASHYLVVTVQSESYMSCYRHYIDISRLDKFLVSTNDRTEVCRYALTSTLKTYKIVEAQGRLGASSTTPTHIGPH
jgi:hypothetical protein